VVARNDPEKPDADFRVRVHRRSQVRLVPVAELR